MLKTTFLATNMAYGTRALHPVRIFSNATSREQILVRIDDNLPRLSRASAAGEDVIQDIGGYLILLRVLDRIDAENEAAKDVVTLPPVARRNGQPL